MALNHFFDLEAIYQVASNEQDVVEKKTLFDHQKKLDKELTAAQRVMGSLMNNSDDDDLQRSLFNVIVIRFRRDSTWSDEREWFELSDHEEQVHVTTSVFCVSCN